MSITADRLKQLLHYEPGTGLFTRKVSVPGSKAGTFAGYPDRYGYIRLRVDGKHYLAHRLAWLFFYEEWPVSGVDHINGQRSDNRLCNLRDVNASLNQQNRKRAQKNSTTEFLGVTFEKRTQKYLAQISAGGTRRFIGRFDSPESAHAAYLCEKRKHHEGCTI